MTIILLWIATSAAVGWFGRKRVIGFWGFFVLSILLSPILTGLFLLLAAPGKRYIAETEQRVAASLRRAGVDAVHDAHAERLTTPMAVHARTPGIRRLVTAWLVVVAVFAGVYMVVGGPPGAGLSPSADEAFGPIDAVRLSFDVATMGTGGGDTTAGSWQWLASLERLIVLGILVMMVSSLISAQLASIRARESVTSTAAPTPGE
jgi:hypothetical protein